MYRPAHFDEPRPEVLRRLVHDHPLGLLITPRADGGIGADPIPFLLDDDSAGGPGVLRGHVARANPLWRETPAGAEALVVFGGPEGYVSPAWYPSKAEHGKVVPTWNYVMVQARGPLRVIDDPAWLRRLVTRLTERHEGTRAAPWAVDDAPADYVDALLRAIVGIEIPLTSLVGKWKVSQNRPAADRAGVAAGLRAEANDTALAAEVERPGGGLA
ncbi:FMN-binding negative transcriptional regulator [Piscinibacter koreensis]|uniref:FMN-binding negative transcriptional regulator n=1 Tax=Piscinibacter koreensis TaxID=2742824 RepID=A0A7Y6NJY7_9BURK|nr:FMN-binding negative transcriptional regulator [Schlegelella koreensis]NUZ04481.1 FMN-binding negative transcriptional regulator [Schlegelella koreensis]